MLRNSERKTNVYCNIGVVFYCMSCNEGAAVILHTPKACSHIELNSYWLLRKRAYIHKQELSLAQYSNLFVTGISDKEAIYGGEKMLRQCLLDVAEQKWVKYLVVVGGCTAGVIGDDIQAVANEVELEIGKPIIVVPGAGFMSKSYVETQIALYEALLERFAPKQTAAALAERKSKAPKTAVLLGENVGYANLYCLKEIKRLLRLAGFERILIPPNSMTMEEFCQIAEAELFLPVGVNREHYKYMVEYGEKLAERYAAKCYSYNYPHGRQGVKDWFLGIGRLLGTSERLQSVIETEEKRVAEIIKASSSKLKDREYILVVGSPRRYSDPLVQIRILDEAGMKLKAVIFHEDLTTKEKLEQQEYIRAYTDVDFHEGNDDTIVAEWNNSYDLVVTTIKLVGMSHQLLIAINSVGSWQVENILRKAAKAMEGQGRRIVYEY